MLSVHLGATNGLRRRTIILLLAVFSLGHTGSVFAVDPPQNIRLENNVLRWDATDNGAKYNIYFLSGPVVNNGVTPVYVTTITNVLEFRPTTDGFYTVVTVVAGNNGSEYSDVADGGTVAFNGAEEETETVSSNTRMEIRSLRCDNVVAGGSCENQCSFTNGRVPTGGACRADAGVVLHQRARTSGFECIAQNDTSFVEVDVYCLRTSNF